ncbi:hypothetical protein JAAARDRAFT_211876 [Jaapia argillacea MUCL 33604]|uniref:Mid2 domain-containing protein n=1 Tax=Jaapia argillacea MUCL 33604 TaxID=933084 RepID=A0A067P8Q6_9AGAM|nr:hypothetical protein JAAARDRAFT_211876 [Jaapia argillacea MUCL 33604]
MCVLVFLELTSPFARVQPSSAVAAVVSEDIPFKMRYINLRGVSGYVLIIAYILSHSLVLAQQNTTFFWGYTLDPSPTLQACQTYSLGIDPGPNNISGLSTPPYYLVAYEVGGITTVTPVGSTSLAWQVTHPAGAQLVITMADAKGNSGGLDPVIRTVTPGSSTTCIPAPDESFVMTSNVTALTTCEPWGLSITGGTPPYDVTVVCVNTAAAFVTNMTVPSGDNVVTYINRGEPNSQMIAAVHDSTGRWGIGTSLVNTAGTNDTTCPGQETSYTSAPPAGVSSSFSKSSSTSQSSSISPTAPQSTAISSSRPTSTSTKKKSIIIGLCVVMVTVLGVAIIGWSLVSKSRGSKKDLSKRPGEHRPMLQSSPPAISTLSSPYKTPSPASFTVVGMPSPTMPTVDSTYDRQQMGYPHMFPYAPHPSHPAPPMASHSPNNPSVSFNRESPGAFTAQNQQQGPEHRTDAAVFSPAISTLSSPYKTPSPASFTVVGMPSPTMPTVDSTYDRQQMGYPHMFPYAPHPSHPAPPMASHSPNNPSVSFNRESPGAFTAQNQQQGPEHRVSFPYGSPSTSPTFPTAIPGGQSQRYFLAQTSLPSAPEGYGSHWPRYPEIQE